MEEPIACECGCKPQLAAWKHDETGTIQNLAYFTCLQCGARTETQCCVLWAITAWNKHINITKPVELKEE